MRILFYVDCISPLGTPYESPIVSYAFLRGTPREHALDTAWRWFDQDYPTWSVVRQFIKHEAR
jgi:hypothetical protein